MAYIAFASAKGSPGVTTTVAALAATWPQGRRLLVAELDPAGGDLAARFDLAPEPGLVTLAAAGRRELDPATLLAHTQAAPGPGRHAGRHTTQAARVLTGPVSAEQAAAALVALRGRLAPVLDAVAADGMDVLVDCGRLDPGSPAQAVALDAGLLVMVTRPVVAEVHHLTSRVASLPSRAVSLLVVGERPYSVEEVAAVVGARPLATLPDDRRAASALSVGHPDAARALRRSDLLRSARAIAEELAHWLGPRQLPSVPTPTPDQPAELPSIPAPAPDVRPGPPERAALPPASGTPGAPSPAQRGRQGVGAGRPGRSTSAGRRRGGRRPLPVPPQAAPHQAPPPPPPPPPGPAPLGGTPRTATDRSDRTAPPPAGPPPLEPPFEVGKVTGPRLAARLGSEVSRASEGPDASGDPEPGPDPDDDGWTWRSLRGHGDNDDGTGTGPDTGIDVDDLPWLEDRQR